MRKQIDKAVQWILIALLSLLILDVVWQVISRYLLASPSSFTDEIAGYLLVWVGLLGGAYAAGQKEHLAIDMLFRKLSVKRRFWIEVGINCIIGLFALFVLLVGGSNLIYTRFLLDVTSASLELNLGYVYLVLPLSGILTLYYMADNSLVLLRSSRHSS